MSIRLDLSNKGVICNVLKTGPVTEPKKLPVHGSLVEPTVELQLDQ